MSMRYKGGVISATAPTTSTSTAKGIWTATQQFQAVGASVWPRSPGAPTIGTATGSAGSATVTYTAPTDLGTGAVTYTATSSPGGLTGTGASPITVSGLTNGTPYTFTVTASTPGGTGPASAASNSVTPALPAIGAAFGGGFYAGQIGVSGVATHYIIIGPVASAQGIMQYKNANTDVPGADSVIDGPQNTADMVADGNATVYPAAHFCNDLVIGGYSDWYMPAKNELEICYFNLKPTTTNNNTSSGINANAVPARASNYPIFGPPTQTAAADFQNAATEAFTAGATYYWTSTEFNTVRAWAQTFLDGTQDNGSGKTNNFRVRAIRRVAV